MTDNTTFTLDQPAYRLRPDEIAQHMGTNVQTGLTKQEASRRHDIVGNNALESEGGVSIWKVLIRQVANALTLVLVMAMALSYGTTDFIEGGVITAVIVLNITIGFLQEYKAEKTMDSLRQLSSPTGAVLRNSEIESVPSISIVPGDIVSLKTGDVVPADVRLFEAMNFETDEALLTGESLPVSKDFEAIYDQDIGVGDRLNMAYSSSTVTRGRAMGIVTSVGMNTEIGNIAETLRAANKRKVRKLSDHVDDNNRISIRERIKFTFLWIRDWAGILLGITTGTPLQQKLSKLAYLLFLLAIVLAIIVFGANKFNVTHQVSIYAISLGIAIIPESLIAVLSITMAIGTRAMAKRHVIVRKLDALEALGGVTNVCSDKTGTLTQGKMITRKAWVIKTNTIFTVNSPEATDPTTGTVQLDTGEAELGPEIQNSVPSEAPSEKYPSPTELLDNESSEFVRAAALCNLATVRRDEQSNKWTVIGDPTEIALQVFAHRFGLGKDSMKQEWIERCEFPFDSAIKRMAVIFEHPQQGSFVFIKGAVERVLEVCTNVELGDDTIDLTEEVKQQVLRQMEKFASQGLRVLALAHRPWTEMADKNTARESVERDATLLGLVGLYDPPRDESRAAVRECHKAGIKVHMLTGDHPETASAIAKAVGIIPENLAERAPEIAKTMVMTAAQFDALTDQEVDNLQSLPLVIARCAPNTKVRMIDALHRRKAYAAMTGDGVNDSPSLKKADVGIAMGMNGSDVAKDASEIVLTDDNFASVVNAIEEGRRMFDNISKFVLHLLCSNVGEVILLIIGLAFRDDDDVSVFPLAPLQILWINMITSSFPAMGLGMEKAMPDVMSRKPHDAKKGVFSNALMMDMAVYGTLMGALCLVAFTIVVFGVGGGELGSNCNEIYSPSCDTVFRARATVFALLTWTLLLFAWECKHFERSLFRLIPGEPIGLRNVLKNIYANKFLFWAIVIAFFSVFPVIYIPVLNVTVFKHKPIGWEWAVVFGGLILFVLGVELWKFMKRKLMRRGENMGKFGRRVKSFVTDESRISASADPAFLLEKPHLFGRSSV